MLLAPLAGLARSELGTLLARNHDEIDMLRWMG
jgi:hypothetical protein